MLRTYLACSAALVQIVTVLSQGQTCPPNWIASATNNKCYLVVTDVSRSWYDAEQYCSVNANGGVGHLVAINSFIEKSDIQTIVRGLNNPNLPNFWIGANNFQFGPAQYSWTDRSPFVYASWGPGQPPSAGTNCIQSAIGTGMDGWAQLPCDYLNGFVCQRTPKNDSCPDNFTYYAPSDSCYTLYSNPADWQQAEKVCKLNTVQGKPGEVVSIRDAAENQFVLSILTTFGSTAPEICNGVDGWIWTGLKSMYANMSISYAWSDGSPITYLNNAFNATAADFPAPGSDGVSTLCGEMTAKNCHVDANTFIGRGMWKGFGCAQQLAFVCKYPAPTPVRKLELS